MKEARGGEGIFKIINFSKTVISHQRRDKNKSFHSYIFFTMKKPVYIIHFIITPKKKVKKPKSSK